MIFLVAHDRHSSAKGSYHIALGNRVFGIIGSLGVNVRLEGEQKLFDGGL